MAGRKEGKGGHGQFLHLSPSSPLTAPYSVPLARSRIPAPQPCPSRPRALARAGIRPECLALQLAFITPRLLVLLPDGGRRERPRPPFTSRGRAADGEECIHRPPPSPPSSSSPSSSSPSSSSPARKIDKRAWKERYEDEMHKAVESHREGGREAGSVLFRTGESLFLSLSFSLDN